MTDSFFPVDLAVSACGDCSDPMGASTPGKTEKSNVDDDVLSMHRAFLTRTLPSGRLPYRKDNIFLRGK